MNQRHYKKEKRGRSKKHKRHIRLYAAGDLEEKECRNKEESCPPACPSVSYFPSCFICNPDDEQTAERAEEPGGESGFAEYHYGKRDHAYIQRRMVEIRFSPQMGCKDVSVPDHLPRSHRLRAVVIRRQPRLREIIKYKNRGKEKQD